MNSEGFPKVAVKLVATMYGGIGLFMVGLVFWRPFGPPLAALWFFWLVLCVGLITPLSTQLTAEGVSQLLLKGRRYTAWNDIKEVRVQSQIITLVAPAGKFVLPLLFFYDSDQAVRFITKNLPPHLRSTVA